MCSSGRMDTGVQSFAVGSLNGVNYVVDLTTDGVLKASSGTGWRTADTGVLDYAFTTLNGTSYLSGHDGKGSFLFSAL